jgi:hypothetical protein
VGSVYLYYLSGQNTWDLSEKIEPEDIGSESATGILFGQSVAVSMHAVALGAPENDVDAQNSGSVFIYGIAFEGCFQGTSF